MGWNSGGDLFDVIIESVMDNVQDKEIRKKIYKPIYEQFLSHDWDTDNECIGLDPAFDEVLKEQYIKRGWDWEN